MIGGADLTDYILRDLYTVTYQDLDGPLAGRTLDGVLHRDKIASKDRIEVTLSPLITDEDLGFITYGLLGKGIVAQEFISVSYHSFGVWRHDVAMYVSNWGYTVRTMRGDLRTLQPIALIER
jgi:hypothetical protein